MSKEGWSVGQMIMLLWIWRRVSLTSQVKSRIALRVHGVGEFLERERRIQHLCGLREMSVRARRVHFCLNTIWINNARSKLPCALCIFGGINLT